MANILAIDDEIPILELIKNGLQKDGHTVSTYPSVSQIPLEYLNRYDLIMLDIMMPDTDGFTFCKKIRSLVDCPILFLTAKTLENDITFGLGIGADDYLTKPFRIAELRARVRDKELIVLQYYIGSRFINPWLNKYFPSPEMILYSLIALNCVFVCILLTIRFSRRLQKQLVPIMNATEEISSQNLDFEIGHSNIKEFEDVLLSFSKMRDDLKMSLEKQWHAEQLQREQIAALAHDLKTPLTVIQGNIDLINETELDDEQCLYADYITESSSQISIYIKTLIDISRTVAGYQLHLEEIDISGYMGQIEAQANSLCLAKGICLHMEKEVDLGIFKTDKLLLERAIMNVISNAVDYSPPLGTIYVTTQKVDHFLHISITDEGTGFTSEAIHHAQEQFFMGDKSRTSNMHFGMGLYITNSIIKQHDGQLILSNSKKTGGAQVIIKIPY